MEKGRKPDITAFRPPRRRNDLCHTGRPAQDRREASLPPADRRPPIGMT